MTQEQKAKAYDKCFVKAKEIYDNENDVLILRTIEDIFPELKENEDEKIRQFLIREIEGTSDEIMSYRNMNKKDVLTWLEKQGEQKPTDKVEPKFHECEWVTNGDYTWKIVEVKPLDYILQSQNGNIVDDTISHVDEQFHSFTIEDAKDGDVLVSKSGDKIFSYRGNLDLRGRPCAHYGIYKVHDGIRFTPCAIGNYFTYEEVYPATKEQRDLLFQKMKESGYEWDANKLELKNLDEKTDAWSEEDEDMIQALNACINAAIKGGTNYISFDSRSILIGKVKNWLKSIKERVQPKPMQEYDDMAYEMSRAVLYDKLKDSLSPQSRWKPSDEQIEMLENVRKILHTNKDIYSKANNLMYNFEELIRTLKKLKA